MSEPLRRVTSIKLKLGLLVAVSVIVAAVLGTVSDVAGVPAWLGIPVTVLMALGVTQLLASGMTSPLRQMTEATRSMARGGYAVRVRATSSDEVGQLARAFNTMAADLAASDRQRRDLVATVSHELRTPLAGLVGVLENLEDGVVPRDPAGIRTALSQAERLGTLVADLLDLARVEEGEGVLAREEVVVADLVAQAVAEARATSGSLGRDVGYDVLVDPPELTVGADPARLHQLLANLLDNASRHCTPGGEVRVSAHGRGPDRWELEVANPGDSIPAEQRERVFERFGSVSDPAGGGTGLGLAIARWVATLHGGTITAVDPVTGAGGTRIVAGLPTGAPPQPDAPRTEETTMTTSTTPIRNPPPLMEELTMGAWSERDLPSRPRLVLAAVGVGLLAALLVADNLPGIGYVLVLLAGGGVVFASSTNKRDPFTLACAALAVPLVAMLMIRDAAWIAVLCALAAAVLCVVGSARTRSVLGVLMAGLLWPFAALQGLPWLGRSLRAVGGDGHGRTLIRTLALSLVAVLAFGLLFASADALFATWVHRLVPGSDLVFRIFTGVAVSGLVLVAAYYALNPPRVEPESARVKVAVQRRYEWLVPVLLIDLVFVAFLAAQAAAAFGSHAYVRRTTGLTYAEYVHQGFGQLTVATALTLLVVWAAGRKAATVTPADRAWLRGAAGLLCLLTLVVVASAVHRMDLYQQAYGFTRLRLLVDAFELWLAVLVVFVLATGVRLRGSWLPRAGLLSGALVLLVLGGLNPDAWIARHNVERYVATGKLDVGYLADLSADAGPELAASPAPADQALCRIGLDRAGHDGVFEWNLGRVRLDRVLPGREPVGDCPTTY